MMLLNEQSKQLAQSSITVANLPIPFGGSPLKIAKSIIRPDVVEVHSDMFIIRLRTREGLKHQDMDTDSSLTSVRTDQGNI